jgi:hypothetical protein
MRKAVQTVELDAIVQESVGCWSSLASSKPLFGPVALSGPSLAIWRDTPTQRNKEAQALSRRITVTDALEAEI